LTLSDYDSMSYLGHLVKDEQSKPTVAGVVVRGFQRRRIIL
jgi:hypothetical protein